MLVIKLAHSFHKDCLNTFQVPIPELGTEVIAKLGCTPGCENPVWLTETCMLGIFILLFFSENSQCFILFYCVIKTFQNEVLVIALVHLNWEIELSCVLVL